MQSAELFQRRGYEATGLAEILTRSAATKGSLYFHFPGGKEQLAATSLSAAARSVATLIEQVLASSPDAATAISACAGAIAAGFEESDFERGSPLSTTALEPAVGSPPIRQACDEGYRSWVELVAASIEREGLDREQAQEWAVLVVSALEGALMLARVQRSTEAIQTVGRRLAEAIAAKCASRP